jgi:hypothetical protein
MTFFGHQYPVNISLLHTMIFYIIFCIPRIDISNDVSYASNRDSMLKL